MTQTAERFGWAARVVSAGFVGALALVAILFLGTPVAQASTFLVTTTMDSVDSNVADGVCADLGGKCSLRAAIQNANRDPDADTIILPAGTYLMMLAGTGEDNAATGDMDILGTVSIIGVSEANTDASLVIIDGGQIDRIFSVGPYGTTASFNATFKNLTLRNAKNTLSGDAYGGAMDSGTTGAMLITIDNLIFEDNYATQDGGAIYMDGGTNRRIDIKNTIFRRNSVTNGSGGAIQFSSGVQYDISDSAFESNTAQYGSALSVNATATGGYVPTINRTTFSGNTANTSGTVYVSGPLNIYNTTISGNSAAQRAGGIRYGGSAGQMLTLRHVTITNNTAGTSGSGAEFSMVNTVVEMHNSIIAGNTGGTELIGTGAGTGTALISANSTNNLVGGGSSLTNGVNGNKTGVGNPGLGALVTDPGSKGKIHIPVKGGLAHNAGNNAQTGGLTTDQRGQTRVVGTVDIGAVELQLTPTSSTVTSSKNPSTVGESVTFTASVTGSGGTPTGTVTFKDGATTLGTASLAAGSATFTTSALTAGTHSITVSYGGDTDFAASASPALTQTVNKAATTTAVSSSANPAVHGQQVTLTANVTSAFAGTISGTVTFKDGAATLGTATLSGGAATWTGTLTVGSHTITAVFSGDGTYNGSTSSGLTQTVNKAATATGLTSSKNPSVYSQNVMFTANVTVTSPGVGTPTGTVTFKDGTTVLAAAQPVSGGYATFSTTALSVGTHNITAVYNGDGNFATSTSSAVNQVVESAVTTTTVVTSRASSPLGELVTFTATVDESITGLEPSGTVTFKNGATTLGTGALNASKQATFSTASLPLGTHTITATYEGDSTFLTSSGTVSQEISTGVTVTTVLASDTTPVFGQSVNLTATVAASVPANGTPGGTVTFTMDGTELGTATLSGGTGTIATPGLTVGNRSITVAYSGNATFAASSSGTYTLPVAQSPTSTSISSSANPSEYGQSVTFTASVSVAGDGAGSPGGSILFMEGVSLLATVPMTGNSATYSTSSLSPGTHPITAHYSSDPNFEASASTAVSQVVNPAVSTTALTSSKSSSAYGETIRLTATVTSAYGAPSDGEVTFTRDGTSIGTVPVVAGAAILDTAALPLGTHNLKAAFSNSAVAAPSASTTLSQTVTTAPTTATVTIAPAGGSLFGQSVSVTATVAPAYTGTPTGDVTFMDDTATLATLPLTGGQAVFTTTALAVGNHKIKVVYAGVSPFDGDTSDVTSYDVSRAATDVALAGPSGGTKFGETATFTATVTVVGPGSGTPTGEVIFKEGTTELGRANLTGGTASFSTSTLSVGTHNVTAEYTGSASFAGDTSTAVAHVVSKGLTTTALAGLPSSSVYGQEVTLRATVTANVVGSGTPAGTVKFMSTGNDLGTVTLDGSGVAELPYTFNVVGIVTVEAVYQGDDSRFATSTSPALEQTVSKATTSTALTVGPTNPTYGDTVTLTATVTVTSGGGTPSGTVIFIDGGTPIGLPVTLVGGTAVRTTSTLGGGVHNLRVEYNDTSTHAASTSSTVSVTVAQAPVTAALTLDNNPVVFGQGLDFDLVLTPTPPAATAPTGDFDLLIDNAVVHTGSIIGTATGGNIGPELTVGTHDISAAYKGDANYTSAASNTVTLTVIDANTTTTATVAATAYGQAIGIPVTVAADSPSQARPFGKVQVLSGTTVLGEADLVPAAATTATATVNVTAALARQHLPVGSYTLTVKYLGAAGFAESAATVSHTVTQAATAVTLSSNATLNTSKYGDTVRLTAVVAPTGAGSGTPTGEVIFVKTDGTTDVELGRSPLVTGTATFDYAGLSVGTHQLKAVYTESQDTNFAASESGQLGHTVTPAVTVTTVIASVASPVWGQSVTFTATVAPASAPGTPGGKVTFMEGTTVLAADIDLDAAGQATYTTSGLSVGSHTITVVYAGAGNYAGSTSAGVTRSVGKAETATAVVAAPAPSHFGAAIAFEATVVANGPGAGLPTGTVTFKDGATTVGTGTLDAAGVAAYTAPTGLSTGTHTITVIYNGDGNFLTSTHELTHVVQQASGSLSVANLSAPYGSTATLTATLAPAAADKEISFTVNGTNIGTAKTNAAGVATKTYQPFLTAGTHDIAVSFAGDADIAANDATGTLTVTQAAGTVTVAAQTGSYRSDVTLEATLSPVAAGRTITFSVNGTAVGTGTTDAAGKATYTYFATVPVGTATVGAAFAGDDEVDAATGTGTLTVNKATGVIVVDDVTDLLRQTVTLRAKLTPAEAGLSVTFKVGATTVGTGTTNAAGVATATHTLGNVQATQTITVSFAGDDNFLAASGTGTLTTNDTKPVMNAIADQTNKEGQTVDFTVSGSDADGDALTFSILDAPPGVGITPAGRITGTIGGTAAAGSPYTVTVKVTDALGGGYAGDTDTTTFTWTVVDDTEAPTWAGTAALTVSAETQTGLTLSWNAEATDDVNVTAYRIYQNGVEIDTVLGTTYSVTGLTKNTNYTFRVEAQDLAGNVSSDGPSADGLTALGAPDLTVSASQPAWLKAGETISLSFPGQPGVDATYSLAYEKWDGTTWAAGTPVTGSLTAGAGAMPTYSATITVPAGAGLWRNLVLTVDATDRTSADTSSTQTLTYQVDTVAPAVGSAETGVTRPLKGGETFTVTVSSEAGLAAAKTTIGGTEYALAPVAGSPGQYAYTYTVGAAENRTVTVAIALTDEAGNVTQQTLTPDVVLDTTAPVITSVTLFSPGRERSGIAYYIEGESLAVEVEADPGLSAVSGKPQDVAVRVPGATLSGLTDGWIHLTETGPDTGIYRGTYVIQPGDSAGTTAAAARLETKVTDLAGNADTLSGDEDLVVDTVAPTVTGVDHDARTVQPVGGKVRLNAWAEPDLFAVTYTFTLDDGTVREGTLTQVPTSPGIYEAFYTVQPGDTTPVGGAPVAITMEKVSGNKVTRTVTHKLMVDTDLPVMGPISVTPSGRELTPGETLTISFTGEPGLEATVTVGELLTNVTMTESPAGTYTASYVIRFGDRAAAAPVSVTARDAVGNPRTLTAADTVTVKSESPVVNVDLSHDPDGRDGWYVTAPILTFRVDAGAVLTLKDGAATVALGAPQRVGSFDVYTYTVPNGQHSYTYQAVQGASLPAAGTLPALKVDTVKPAAPTLTSTVTATRLNTITLNAAWPGAAGVTELELMVRGHYYGRYAVTGSSLVIPNVQLQEGANPFTAKVYDQAGNVSPVSAAVTITRDTTAPTFDITVDVNGRLITITPSEPLATTPALTVQATANGTPLTVFTTGASAGGVYTYRWTENASNQATISVSVTGSDLTGNAGTGNWVSTRLTPSHGGKVDNGSVSAEFPPGALTDGVVLMSTFSAGRLSGTTYVPPGTQLMGVYEFDANLLPGAQVAISFELEFTGTLPPTVGVYHMNVGNPNAAPTYVPGTMTVLSTRTVTDAASGTPITVYKVRIEATLPHFSVWAPFADGTAPDFTGEVKVNGAVATGQVLNTTTVTVTGTVDGTARTMEAELGGGVVAAQDLGALTTADKSFSLSVPLGADGPKTITVKATDEFGNWRDMNLSITLDTQAPTITNLKFGADAYTPGTTAATTAASIRFSGSTDGAASLTVTGPSGTVISGALVGFDVNLSLAPGDNTYTVVAVDAAGNQSAPVTAVIRRDNTPPVAALTALNSVTPDLSVTFGYTVNEAVKSVVLSADGGALLGAGMTPTLTLADQARSDIQLTFPGNGTYTVTATVTDLAGNVTLVSQSITRDGVAPKVTLALSQNPTRTGAVLTATGSLGGLPANGDPVTIWLRGSIVTPASAKMTGGTYTYTFDANDLVEGENAVLVSLVGSNAVSGSAATVIIKDTIAPSATGLTASPVRTQGAATVNYTLTEAATAVLQYSDNGGTTWTTAESVSRPAGAAARPIILPTDGTYQFQVVLTDAAGNTQTLPVSGTVTVDQTNPVINPAGLPTSTGSHDLTFGYVVLEPVQSVTISATGGATLGLTTSTEQAKNGISLHFPADGTYTVTITATDLVGNTSSVKRAILVDSKLPAVVANVSSPLTTTGSTLTLTITVGGTPIPDDATVSLVRNGHKVTLADDHPSGGTFTHAFAAADLDEGDNVIDVTVARSNGLTSSLSTLITKDTIPPDATALSFSAQSTYATDVDLRFTLSEPAKVRIERRKTGGAWTEVYNSGAAYLAAGAQTRTVSLPELSMYEFRITVTDVIGFTASRDFPGTVTRVEPPVEAAPLLTVNASETLTRRSAVTLSGTATVGAQVTIRLGDQELTALTIGAAGTFQYEAPLAEGTNLFTVTASRLGKTTTATITVTRDTAPPVLVVTAEHTADTAVWATLVIATEPGARVRLGDEPVTLRPDGTARVPVQLTVGSNQFTVTATDAAGNDAAKTVTVVRKGAGPGPGPDPDPDPTPCTAAGAQFTDIIGHWAEEAIRCLVDSKVVTGFPDNTFRPETTVSRAQFMVMLGRALGLTPDAEPVLPFTDSDEIQTWAQGYISALYKEGLVRGDAQGTFRPEAEISRAELAVLLARVLAYKGIQVQPGEVQFTDEEQVPAWAMDSLRVAVAAGLITGFEDGSFRPAASATRAQSAVLIRRLQLKLSEQ